MRRLMVGTLAAAGLVVAARKALLIVTVRGDSMAPTLLSGDRVLAVRRVRRPRRGDVVVARMPDARPDQDTPRPNVELITKRLTGLPGDLAPDGSRVGPGQYVLTGDGTSSYDSRDFGPVPEDLIVAVVIKQLPRPPVRPG